MVSHIYEHRRADPFLFRNEHDGFSQLGADAHADLHAHIVQRFLHRADICLLHEHMGDQSRYLIRGDAFRHFRGGYAVHKKEHRGAVHQGISGLFFTLFQRQGNQPVYIRRLRLAGLPQRKSGVGQKQIGKGRRHRQRHIPDADAAFLLCLLQSFHHRIVQTLLVDKDTVPVAFICANTGPVHHDAVTVCHASAKADDFRAAYIQYRSGFHALILRSLITSHGNSAYAKNAGLPSYTDGL